MTDTTMERTRDHLLALAFALLVVGLPVLYSTSVAYPFSSPKLAVLGAAVALGVVAVALPSKARLGGASRLRVALLVLAASLATVALAFSPVLGVSFWGRHDQEVGYLVVLSSLGAYAIGVAFLPAMGRWPRLLDLALLPAGLLAALSIWTVAGLPVPGYFFGNADAGPVLTMGNPTHVGAYLAAMFAFALSRAIREVGRRRLFLTALALLLCAGAVTSGSFAAMIALAAGALWVSWNALRGRGRIRWLIPSVTIVILAAGIALGSVLPGSPLTNAFTVRGGDRMETYWVALKTIVANPLLGVGPANFQSALLSQLTPELVHTTYYAQVSADAHDWFLEFGATYGLLFAVVLASLLVTPLVRRTGRTTAQEPAAGAALGLAVAYLFGPIALSTLPLLAFFSGVAAARAATEPVEARADFAARAARHAGSIALVALAGIVLAGSMHFLSVDYEVRQGALYGQTDRITSAARRLAPQLPDPYWTAGKLAAFEGRFNAAPERAAQVDGLFAEAEKLDPWEPLTQIQWGVALQVLHRHEDAVLRFRRALELYPDWPLSLKGMAFSYLEEGRADLALPILTDMSALYPDDPVVAQLLQRARQAQP